MAAMAAARKQLRHPRGERPEAGAGASQ